MLEGDYNTCVHNMLPNIYRNYFKQNANYCYQHLKKQDFKTKKTIWRAEKGHYNLHIDGEKFELSRSER